MDKIEVSMLVNDTIANFSKLIDSPIVLFVNKDRFSHLLDLMKLEKHLDYTPSFVVSTKGGPVVYYCMKIINALTANLDLKEKKTFVQGVTIHELLHIWNGVNGHTVGEAVFAEKLVSTEMKNLYPEHYEFLKKFQANV